MREETANHNLRTSPYFQVAAETQFKRSFDALQNLISVHASSPTPVILTNQILKRARTLK